MKRIFITLLAAVMLMLSFTACSEEAIDDIIKSGEQAVSNIYLGSNEQIAEISKNLKSDDIKESMKQSNLYDLLIQVVANDSFEFTMNDLTLSYSGTKCYLGNANEYAYIKDFLTVYAIDYKKQTYGYIFVDYDGFIDEIYEISPIDIFLLIFITVNLLKAGQK
ncbi:MAG: hypothetical protein IJC04_07480 [Oscillospiraceae bacterium]|nr:hypothetical protein [Oscillospiraceae bacterium]